MSDSAAISRVEELIARFGAPDVSVAKLLCDDHDPSALAYRIVAPDLTVVDLTYGELRRESERFAAAMTDLGLGEGDRIATLMGKSREYLIALMGIWRMGAVHVPLFTAFAPPAIAERLIGSKAKAVVCDAAQAGKLDPSEVIPRYPQWRVITTGPGTDESLSFHELLDSGGPALPAAAVGGDAPLIHVYTSGTTGRPKGVVVPVRALAAVQSYAEFGQGLRPSDMFWCAADPGWAYGLYFGILATFTTGTPSILFEGGFSAETTMAVLSQQGVTNFAAAPTVYRALRSSGIEPANLRLERASSAGEPLTPEVNAWAETALGVTVHDHYGQTEVGMLINNHHHPDAGRPIKPGSMGQAMPGWTATVLHPKRAEEVGPNVVGRVAMVVAESPLATFSGYDRDPAKSATKFTGGGKWYLTGGRCQSNEERSPLGKYRSLSKFSQAARICHSAQAAERRSL
jgi:acetyl-CoA synthetase